MSLSEGNYGGLLSYTNLGDMKMKGDDEEYGDFNYDGY